jgi:hypothetical protein
MIKHLFGLFFAQSRHGHGHGHGIFILATRARIGAAVAGGMALRAMGCSLMGHRVSKVFFRHVAPTRYGDQTLSAGEHLAPDYGNFFLK